MSSSNIVFIDGRVTDYQILVTGLSTDADWLPIGHNMGGGQQLAAAIAGRTLKSNQIVSHGLAGALAALDLDAKQADHIQHLATTRCISYWPLGV